MTEEEKPKPKIEIKYNAPPKPKYKYRIHPLKGESELSRKKILEKLNSHSKRDPDKNWVDIRAELSAEVTHLSRYTAYLLKLGLIDTKSVKDKNGDPVLFARINFDGQQALVNNTFTYSALQMPLQIQAPMMRRLERIAEELDIMRTTGRRIGEVPSVVALLQAIVDKEEPFKRWFKFVWAASYEEKDGKAKD